VDALEQLILENMILRRALKDNGAGNSVKFSLAGRRDPDLLRVVQEQASAVRVEIPKLGRSGLVTITITVVVTIRVAVTLILTFAITIMGPMMARRDDVTGLREMDEHLCGCLVVQHGDVDRARI